MGTLWPVSPEKYLAFLTVMFAMSIMPGPAILFAVAAGMSKGFKGALLATLGMNLAALLWFVGSAFGLVILAATVPWVFKVTGWLGVAYILWLGIDALRGALKADAAPPRALKAPSSAVFRDGFIVQATNPKALLFFTAVLPPFVEVDRAVWPQMGAFAVALVALDSFFMIGYGVLGAAFAHKMDEPRFRRLFGLFVGIVLIAVAALMATRI
ncbi:MAG TPA: LysE family translocator [Magnetospirillaceae bacterium]|nr:LysE family translocator [Magnetospirillaceae bacterium]